MAESSGDKKQIGLTPAGSAALEVLMNSENFEAESDAYRLGIAYALANGLSPSEAPPRGYLTKYNAAGGLDSYGDVRDLVTILLPEASDRPYATAEKLAEIGVTALAARLEAHESMADILRSSLPEEESESDQDSQRDSQL